nr:MAG TPA: hypothetical protein [Bacteriophage sp.]
MVFEDFANCEATCPFMFLRIIVDCVKQFARHSNRKLF